ncbi:Asp-tRNA(Asn)/Glu-tRNA(Gln) amidotransferase GatCAB subunit B, partial [Candidatus Omnitrophota bacterium]
KQRFVTEYAIPVFDASVLTQEKRLADFYEETVACKCAPKVVSNWVVNELLGQMKSRSISIEALSITPIAMANLIEMIDKGIISGKIAKEVLAEMFVTDALPEEIVKKKGLMQISDESAIEEIIDAIINTNPKSVNDYKGGKQNALGFLVGQVMKQTKGKANPALVNKLLSKKLNDK